MKTVKISTGDLIDWIRKNADSFAIQGERISCSFKADTAYVTFVCPQYTPLIAEDAETS